MQDLFETPFNGYDSKDELRKSIKYFVEQYISLYVGLIYAENNMQNYLGPSITKRIIENVRFNYPKIISENEWANRRKDFNYLNVDKH